MINDESGHSKSNWMIVINIYCLQRMGCGSSSQSRLCADQELEAALARFPPQEVEGAEEKLGMGQPADTQFSNIRQRSALASDHPGLLNSGFLRSKVPM